MEQRSNWKVIYRIGAVAAVLAVALAILEMLITFLPGGAEVQETVADYFFFLQRHPLLGMRNLGLINIGINMMLFAAFFGIFAAVRETKQQPIAVLTMVMAFVGLAVFFATNRAFAMFALSQEYAAAATEAQKALLEAAGKAMLAVGQNHTAGTFLAFFLMELSGLMISLIMLRGEVFGKVGAVAGVLGFSTLLVFEIVSSFGSDLGMALMLVATLGGIASVVWYLNVAKTLFQLSK
ncbi:hypothetical protein KQH54_00290 [bacterium]|nr:hypothetical protein [bacterium]